jgi:hypothetical protein
MKRNCEGEMIHLYESLWEKDTLWQFRYVARGPQTPIVEAATRKREDEERGWKWMEEKGRNKVAVKRAKQGYSGQ